MSSSYSQLLGRDPSSPNEQLHPFLLRTLVRHLLSSLPCLTPPLADSSEKPFSALPCSVGATKLICL